MTYDMFDLWSHFTYSNTHNQGPKGSSMLQEVSYLATAGDK